MKKKFLIKVLFVFGTSVWRDDGLMVSTRHKLCKCQASKIDKDAILQMVNEEEIQEKREVGTTLNEEMEEFGTLVKFRASRSGERLDLAVWRHFCAEEKEYSRSYWADIISRGKVRVNGQIQSRKANNVESDDIIEVQLDKMQDSPAIKPEAINLSILYEDDDIIVLNKPAGMVTHPAPGHPNGTLANALAYHCADADIFTQASTDARPGLVHRLDKGTTGVIVATKTLRAQARLTDAFRNRQVEKIYLAVCAGGAHLIWSDDDALAQSRVIETHIARHPTKRDRMAIVSAPEDGGPPTARYAKSTLRPLATDSKRSVLQVQIHTGRTHQIRVHLAHLRMPVLADDLYGDPTYNRIAAKPPFLARRPLLHAWTLSFAHPTTNERLTFTAPPPDDMARAIRLISGMMDNNKYVL